MKNFYKYFLILIAIFFLGNNVLADDNEYFQINLDKDTIARGYTVSAFTDEIKLSLVPGILSSSTLVEMIKLKEEMDFPWQLEKVSEVYQFEFKNKISYDNHKPFYIQISYKDDNRYKQVFFYDKNLSYWRPLPTKDYPQENFVRSLIHLPYARIAVFSYPKTLIEGRASWYAGKKSGNFVASPDFGIGSILRVYNKQNKKFVDVEVNDYGPDRVLHPDRAVDLDKKAFEQLASLEQGTIEVVVEPLVIKEKNDEVAKKETKLNSSIETSVKSAIVMDAKNGDIIFAKNENEVLPLASLTKIVAIKVFLEHNKDIDLNKVVAYDKQDKAYNYEFCDPIYSIASLKITDKATLTIKDLIYTSLVGSANNTVETLVRISGLSRVDFMTEMNKLVKSWGADSTIFFDPTGLSPDNKTTAQDYAKISKKALADPIIQNASVTKVYEFYTSDSKKIHTIRNTNDLVKYNSLNNISGSKTGYLVEAGYCLMTRVQDKSGKDVIVVTLGADNKNTSVNETKKLLEYGIKNI